MPRPTKPPCIGSCPEPPPEMIADLALARRVGPDDDVRLDDPQEVAVRRRHPGEGLVDNVFRRVDELLHDPRSDAPARS